MFQLLWENLENFSKEELCDIYWNIAGGVWGRRIGRNPKDFDFLPDESKNVLQTRNLRNGGLNLACYISENTRAMIATITARKSTTLSITYCFIF